MAPLLSSEYPKPSPSRIFFATATITCSMAAATSAQGRNHARTHNHAHRLPSVVLVSKFPDRFREHLLTADGALISSFQSRRLYIFTRHHFRLWL